MNISDIIALLQVLVDILGVIVTGIIALMAYRLNRTLSELQIFDLKQKYKPDLRVTKFVINDPTSEPSLSQLYAFNLDENGDTAYASLKNHFKFKELPYKDFEYFLKNKNSIMWNKNLGGNSFSLFLNIKKTDQRTMFIAHRINTITLENRGYPIRQIKITSCFVLSDSWIELTASNIKIPASLSDPSDTVEIDISTIEDTTLHLSCIPQNSGKNNYFGVNLINKPIPVNMPIFQKLVFNLTVAGKQSTNYNIEINTSSGSFEVDLSEGTFNP